MLNGYLIDFVVCPIVIALSSKLHFVVKFFLLFFVLVVVVGGMVVIRYRTGINGWFTTRRLLTGAR
jgi:thiosulfate reductase cytochrome b subunit